MMGKKCTIVLVGLVCLFSNINTQAQTTFERNYWINNTADFKEDNNGDFAHVATKSSWNNDSLLLWKSNDTGAVIWAKNIGGTDDYTAKDLYVTTGNKYTLLGNNTSDFSLSQTNDAGNILWSKTYGDAATFDEAMWLIQTNDGGFAFCGFAKAAPADLGGELVIVKTDATGSLQWAKTYTYNNPVRPTAIEETSNNGFIVVAIDNPFMPGPHGEIIALKVDQSGDFEWSKGYPKGDDGSGDVIELTNGEFLISGFCVPQNTTFSHAQLIKIDANGNFIDAMWFNENLANPNNNYGYNEINIRNNGNYLVTGGGYDECFGCFYYLEIDKNLSVIQKRLYNWLSVGSETNHSVFETQDGGIAVSNKAATMLKLDKDGLIDCQTPISYLETHIIITPHSLTPTVTVMNTTANDNLNDFNSLVLGNYSCPVDTVFNPIGFEVDTQLICEGECVNFTDTSSNNPIAWEWTFIGGTPATSNQQNPQVCYNTSGFYDVKMVITDANNNKDSVIKNSYIEVINCAIPDAQFTMNSNEICNTECIDFTDATTNTPSQWEWTFEGGNPATSNLQNPQVCYDVPGVYSVKLIASSNDGTDSITQIITVKDCSPKPDFEIGKETICQYGCIDFSDNSTNSPTSWNWTFEGGTPATSNQQNPGEVCFDDAGTFAITLEVNNAYGINTYTTQITVINTDDPLYLDTTILKAGDPVQLVLDENGSYHWSPSEGLNCTNCNDPYATVIEPMQYNVISIDKNGCEREIVYTININENSICNLNNAYVPNSFTPNGDGLNDEFSIAIPNLHSDIVFRVYNRWGEQIFLEGENGQIEDNGKEITINWKGKYMKNEVQITTYVYQLATTCNGSKRKRIGHVNVIK